MRFVLSKSVGYKEKFDKFVYLFCPNSGTIFCEPYHSYHVIPHRERMQAFEMRCYRRLLNISYKDHITYEEVCRKIRAAIAEYDELLTLVNKRKLR